MKLKLNNDCNHGNSRIKKIKNWNFTVFCIVLTPFHTDDEASWLRNTELHPRWAAPSDLRHLGLKRYPL